MGSSSGDRVYGTPIVSDIAAVVGDGVKKLVAEYGPAGFWGCFVILPLIISLIFSHYLAAAWQSVLSFFGVFVSVTTGFLINVLFMSLSGSFFPKPLERMNFIEMHRYVRVLRALVMYGIFVGIFATFLMFVTTVYFKDVLVCATLWVVIHYFAVLIDLLGKVRWLLLAKFA